MATRNYACIIKECTGIVKWICKDLDKKEPCPTCGHLHIMPFVSEGHFECDKCKKTYSSYSPRYDTEEVPCLHLEEKYR